MHKKFRGRKKGVLRGGGNESDVCLKKAKFVGEYLIEKEPGDLLSPSLRLIINNIYDD